MFIEEYELIRDEQTLLRRCNSDKYSVWLKFKRTGVLYNSDKITELFPFGDSSDFSTFVKINYCLSGLITQEDYDYLLYTVCNGKPIVDEDYLYLNCEFVSVEKGDFLYIKENDKIIFFRKHDVLK